MEEIRDLTRVVTSLDRSVGKRGRLGLTRRAGRRESAGGPEEEVEVNLRDKASCAKQSTSCPRPERRVIQLSGDGIYGDDPTPICEAPAASWR